MTFQKKSSLSFANIPNMPKHKYLNDEQSYSLVFILNYITCITDMRLPDKKAFLVVILVKVSEEYKAEEIFDLRVQTSI